MGAPAAAANRNQLELARTSGCSPAGSAASHTVKLRAAMSPLKHVGHVDTRISWLKAGSASMTISQAESIQAWPEAAACAGPRPTAWEWNVEQSCR